jgi:hypothetical protein
LLHQHIVQLIACLSKLRLLHELTLTTNGQAVAAKAAALHAAGLDRINVSLDTLDPHRFEWITRGGQLAPTLGGRQSEIDNWYVCHRCVSSGRIGGDSRPDDFLEPGEIDQVHVAVAVKVESGASRV